MSVKKCPHCGKDLPEELQFCPYCMERITEPVAVTVPDGKKKLNKKSIIIIIVAIVLVLLLAGGIAFFSHYKNAESDINVNNNVSTEDINTTESTNTTETTSGSDTSKENDIFVPDNKDASHENPTNNKTDKEENKTTNANKDNTSSTTTTSATNNIVSECEHNWVTQTQTVHHDEVGHYETVEKQRKVTKYKCPVCYEKLVSLDEYYTHFDNTHKPSYDGDPITILREQYTTESGYEYYTMQEWVVDEEAYDEVVITGSNCSICGEEK